MIRRNRWKPGPVPAGGGPVLVSATRFVYSRWRHMPAVWRLGWSLRRRWGARPGSLGVFTAIEAFEPVTYSVSVWRAESDLAAFLRDPEHVDLIRRFRGRLAASESLRFEMEAFSPEEAWREGIGRLGAGAVPSVIPNAR